MPPLALTDSQLAQVMLTAGPIPPRLHDEYLVLVAAALAGRKFDDGDVYRACASAVKTVMWGGSGGVLKKPKRVWKKRIRRLPDLATEVRAADRAVRRERLSAFRRMRAAATTQLRLLQQTNLIKPETSPCA
jgi:hypothetical protein